MKIPASYIEKVFETDGRSVQVCAYVRRDYAHGNAVLIQAVNLCSEISSAIRVGELVELRTHKACTTEQSRFICAAFRRACLHAAKTKEVSRKVRARA